jgi:AAA15 family ATPase/GTPase
MAINRVEIKDFLVFKGEFSMEFCPGVNVLIGGNATGKTTLLKCLYGATDTIGYGTSRYFNVPPSWSGDHDICKVYGMTHEDFIKRRAEDDNYPPIIVLMSQSEEWDKIDKEYHSRVDEIASHSQKGRMLNEEYLANPLDFNVTKKSVMIPTTEMLSHSKGLLALVYERMMPFEQTEIDILVKAQTPETRQITPNALKILEKIKRIIGGEVVFQDDTFYTQKENGDKIPFFLEASGYRKFGLLWKLLRNGLLESGTALFWDEPENSLNPELVPVLVDILLELSRNGVQVFVATHSKILSEYFAVSRQKGDTVFFYSLYKDGEQIKYDKDDRFDLLVPNNLVSEPVHLYKKQIERGLGGNE